MGLNKYDHLHPLAPIFGAAGSLTLLTLTFISRQELALSKWNFRLAFAFFIPYIMMCSLGFYFQLRSEINFAKRRKMIEDYKSKEKH